MPIIGFRVWRLDSKGLHSLNSWHLWNNAKMNAQCSAGHRVPEEKCMCGGYAFFTQKQAQNAATNSIGEFDFIIRIIRILWKLLGVEWTDELIYGAVIGWGKVIVHEKGFRSEFQQIIALGSINKQSEGTALMAQKLDIPILEPASLNLYAEEFGTIRVMKPFSLKIKIKLIGFYSICIAFMAIPALFYFPFRNLEKLMKTILQSLKKQMYNRYFGRYSRRARSPETLTWIERKLIRH